jgi:regulator of protease activity HflC (stomatin/prohibitin superfamily)
MMDKFKDRGNEFMNNILKGKTIISIILIVLALMILRGTWFTVGVGQVGVTFNKITGSTKSYNQGLHFKLPIIVSMTKFDVKTQRIDITADSASKDLQDVKVHVVLNHHLLYDKVNELFVKVGQDYMEKVIEPAVNESVKATTAQFPIEDIIVKRQVLKESIEKSLSERLGKYNIVLESLNLVNIIFSPEFSKVVEQKQIEEQKIKTAEYQKMQAEQYKQKTILEAQAEAAKQELLRKTVTKDIVSLEWIKKWNGELPKTMLGDKSIPMIQIDNK